MSERIELVTRAIMELRTQFTLQGFVPFHEDLLIANTAINAADETSPLHTEIARLKAEIERLREKACAVFAQRYGSVYALWNSIDALRSEVEG